MSQKSTKSGAQTKTQTKTQTKSESKSAPKGSTKQTSTNTNSNKHVTKISAKNQAKIAKAAAKANGRPAKSVSKKPEKPLKKVFILARPFVALGRYLRDSWRELRQVRWPSRKATWKMTLAVLCYCAIFIVFIVILDSFFTFIFNLLLGRN